MDSFAPRDPLTEQIIGLAITVHRELGPELLESAYEERLCYELKDNRIDFARPAVTGLRLCACSLSRPPCMIPAVRLQKTQKLADRSASVSF